MSIRGIVGCGEEGAEVAGVSLKRPDSRLRRTARGGPCPTLRMPPWRVRCRPLGRMIP